MKKQTEKKGQTQNNELMLNVLGFSMSQNELKNDLISDIKNESKNDLTSGIQNDLTSNIKNESKNVLTNDIKNEPINELINKSKDDLFINKKKIIKLNQKKGKIEELSNESIKKQPMRICISDKTYEILEKGDKHVKRIIHMSDIHIRNERYDEYMYVFNNLFNKLKELNVNEDDLIYVGGDVLQDRNEYSKKNNETMNIMLTLLMHFFYELCKFCPVIVIIGNHDTSKNDPIMDNLRPLMGHTFKSDHKLWVLGDNCNYEYNNIVFSVTNTFETKKVTKCETDKIKIGLYHGMLINSKIEINNKIITSNDKCIFSVGDFSSFDWVLLGDIHCYQKLTERILYSGSLIQQNFGESQMKGINVVNLKTNTSEFIEISNKYAKINLIIDDSTNIDELVNRMPENVEIKTYLSTTNKKKIDEMIELCNKRGIKILENTPIYDINNSLKASVKIDDEEVDLSKITNKEESITFLLNIIKKNNTLNEQQEKYLTSFMTKNMEKYISTNENKEITLKNIKFDNILIYDEGNIINFDKMKNKIIGLTGEMNIGKSNIIRIIYFAIYGSFNKSDENYYNNKINNIINIDSFTCETEIELSVNNRKIIIHRTYRNNNNKSCVVYIDDIIVDSSLDSIIKYICDPEDLLRYSIITQFNSKSILNMPAKERKQLICDMIGIGMYNNILNIGKQEMINKKSTLTEKNNEQIKKYSRYGLNIDNIYLEVKKIIENMNKLIVEKNKKSEDNIEKINKIKTLITENNTKREMILKYHNVNVIHDTQILKEMDDLTNKYNELNEEMQILQNDINILETKIKNKKIIQLNDKFNEKKSNNIQKIKNEINMLYKKLTITEKNDKLNVDIENENKILIGQREKLKQTIIELDDQIKILTNMKYKIPKNIDKIKKEYDNYINNKNILEKSNEQLKNLLNNKKILDEEEKLFEQYKYDPHCEYCISNLSDKHKMHNNLKESITTQIIMLEKNIVDYTDYNNKHQKYDLQYNTILDVINKKQINENKLLNLKYELEKNTNEIVKIEKMINTNDIIIQNRKYEEEIEIKTNKLKEIENTSFDKYNEYIEHKNNYDNKTKLMNEKKLLCQMYENKIKDLTNEYQKININKEQLNEYKKLEELVNIYINQINEIEKENTIIYTKIGELNTEQKNYTKDETLIEEYIKWKNNEEQEIICLTLFIECINKTKIISSILDNSLQYLNDSVNIILDSLGLDKMRLIHQNNAVEIYKYVNNVYLSNSGGGYSHIYNIIFRLIMTQLCNKLKFKFMIIDELFDNCDSYGKKSMVCLLDYVKKYVEWVIIISHDDNVKINFNDNIEIISNKIISHVVYN